jgi:regulator of sigma E protease
MTFLSALVLLGILIFVHEFGHFLFAKLLRVRVVKFSLGFGPNLIGKNCGETEYLISSIPLGGYVKMLGENPDEELKEEDKLFAYNRQPVWKRLLIVLFGPIFNILFAAVVFFLVFLNGIPALYPEVGEIVKDSPAARSALAKGDRVIEINGVEIHQWDDMTTIIHQNPDKPLNFTIKRDGTTFRVVITPEMKKLKNIFGEEEKIGLIGIKPSGSTFVKKENIIGAAKAGIIRTWEISVLTVVSIVKLIQRVIPADTIGGPILIVQMAGDQASKGT